MNFPPQGTFNLQHSFNAESHHLRTLTSSSSPSLETTKKDSWTYEGSDISITEPNSSSEVRNVRTRAPDQTIAHQNCKWS